MDWGTEVFYERHSQMPLRDFAYRIPLHAGPQSESTFVFPITASSACWLFAGYAMYLLALRSAHRPGRDLFGSLLIMAIAWCAYARADQWIKIPPYNQHMYS